MAPAAPAAEQHPTAASNEPSTAAVVEGAGDMITKIAQEIGNLVLAELAKQSLQKIRADLEKNLKVWVEKEVKDAMGSFKMGETPAEAPVAAPAEAQAAPAEATPEATAQPAAAAPEAQVAPAAVIPEVITQPAAAAPEEAKPAEEHKEEKTEEHKEQPAEASTAPIGAL